MGPQGLAAEEIGKTGEGLEEIRHETHHSMDSGTAGQEAGMRLQKRMRHEAKRRQKHAIGKRRTEIVSDL